METIELIKRRIQEEVNDLRELKDSDAKNQAIGLMLALGIIEEVTGEEE